MHNFTWSRNLPVNVVFEWIILEYDVMIIIIHFKVFMHVFKICLKYRREHDYRPESSRQTEKALTHCLLNIFMISFHQQYSKMICTLSIPHTTPESEIK